LSFGPTVSPATAIEFWIPIVDALSAFAAQLDTTSTGTAIQPNEKTASRITAFQQSVAAVKAPLKPIFDAFAMQVVEDDPPAAPV
jgi:hypothetical protein